MITTEPDPRTNNFNEGGGDRTEVEEILGLDAHPRPKKGVPRPPRKHQRQPATAIPVTSRAELDQARVAYFINIMTDEDRYIQGILSEVGFPVNIKDIRCNKY